MHIKQHKVILRTCIRMIKVKSTDPTMFRGDVVEVIVLVGMYGATTDPEKGSGFLGKE